MAEFDAKRARTKRPMPLWWDAFLRDTMHLEADEAGAYFFILGAMWCRPSLDLPADSKSMARVSRVTQRVWNTRIKHVILPFLTEKDGMVTSQRLRKESSFVERQVKQQSDRKKQYKNDKLLKNNEVGSSVDNTVDSSVEHPTQQPNNPIYSISDPSDPRHLAEKDDGVDEAFKSYNAQAEINNWPKAQILSKPRISKLKKRVQDCGGIDGWNIALEKAVASDFLNNRTKTNFTNSLDFMLQQSSFTKLMEGNYDNRISKNREGGDTSRRDPMRSMVAGFEQAGQEERNQD